MTQHCFTYGSLMCEDIMSAVCGQPVHGWPATLAGHARHPVRDEDYPGMVPTAGTLVTGVLYRDLAPAVWPRLDSFEGEMYQRQIVTVTTPAGEALEAHTYLFRPACQHLLLPGDWDFEAFLGQGKQRFTHRYLGFGRI